LLTNFSQGYHSKRLLDALCRFPGEISTRPVLWHWRGDAA
jgi:hypothetical protein